MPGEQFPSPELDLELVQAFARTFIPRWDCYPAQNQTEPNQGAYRTEYAPLTLEMVKAHLLGELTLGAYALDASSQAKWLCLDADDREQWQGLWHLARRLERQGVAAYPEPSRRGGHLWLFLSPIAGEDARRLGLQLQAEYALLDVELFPKQDRLTSGPGSLVRLPLGVHRKDGRRYSFLNGLGQPLAPTIREQIKLLSEPARVPEGFVTAMLANAPAPRTSLPEPVFAPPEDEQPFIAPDLPPDAPLSERLKARISVYDFVSQYVELDRHARGHCPFHDDEHKSFGVNQDQNYWACHAGCGGGDLIHFWRKWRERHGQDPDFIETLKDLADMLLPPAGNR